MNKLCFIPGKIRSKTKRSFTIFLSTFSILLLIDCVKDTDKYSVMGQGMELREKHAKPWCEAITLITGKGNILSSADWITNRKRHYPGTIAEVAANKPIVVRSER
jgi:hypothetical protein